MVLIALVGFILGFFGSVPIAGPIAALVLRRGLQGRTRAGVCIALGASVAEGIYAYLAFWGMGELMAEVPWVEPVSRTVGAALLLLLGLLFVFHPPQTADAPDSSETTEGTKRNLALGFSITALNPTLIATWSAAVTMGYSLLPGPLDTSQALPFSAGATLGISIWFMILLWLIGRYRQRFEPSTMKRVVRGTGLFLIILGGGAAVRFGLELL